ncbi:murein L,D-transpeptidase catalytic domain family protein [candidate division WOR-3 bacterium]|nr:murein L,D-transpeptidase catalytic domain family protein [candidate division WOR-3 bacterium]
MLMVVLIAFNISAIYSNRIKYNVKNIYEKCKLSTIIDYEIFEVAMDGFMKIELEKDNVIAIIDYSKSSQEKRFYVIDLKNIILLYHCLVAHGKNSGNIYANKFSNRENSKMSCNGFFISGETFIGKHGYSLKLDGIEKNINDNARKRGIIIHGASYVSEDFIRKYGRLGKSWGCPALPMELSKKIIDTIKDGSCIFIYGK